MIVSAGTFLSTMLICRNCSDADFGIFSLAWTIIAFLRTIQERMIAAPFLAFTFRPTFNRTSFRGSTLAHQAVFSTASTFLVFTAVVVVRMLGFDGGHFWFGLSLALALWSTLGRDQMRYVSFTDFAIFRLLLLDLLVVALQLIGLVVLIRTEVFSIFLANLVLAFGCLLPIVAWLWMTRRTYDIDHEAVALDWHHNWNYARWLVLARIFGIAPVVVIPWLIFSFEGDTGNGVFGACTSLVGVSLMFVQGANNLFQPRTILELQKNGIRGLLTAVGESTGVICVGLFCISIGFLFFGNNLLAILGTQYVGFGFLTFLLSVSTLVLSISTMLSNGLAALKKSKDFFWGEVSYCIVSIASALVLIPSQGLNGAAYAMILGGLAVTIVTAIKLADGVYNYAAESNTIETSDFSMPCEIAPCEIAPCEIVPCKTERT
ncbi:MAG: polysaccharide biosynthesis C-terminal domain-containing protein [Planctomycetota bacterium]|nr:polysaccharide biosynthesis C-terminal domain-containing protein [Planctomycetota bacterium]